MRKPKDFDAALRALTDKTKTLKQNKRRQLGDLIMATGADSRSTIYRKIEEETFPRQVRISEHCCGWRESDLNRWIGDPQGYGQNGTAESFRATTKPSGQQQIARAGLQAAEEI